MAGKVRTNFTILPRCKDGNNQKGWNYPFKKICKIVCWMVSLLWVDLSCCFSILAHLIEESMSAIWDVHWNFCSSKFCEGLSIKDKEETALFLNKVAQHYHTCHIWILWTFITYMWLIIYYMTKILQQISALCSPGASFIKYCSTFDLR